MQTVSEAAGSILFLEKKIFAMNSFSELPNHLDPKIHRSRNHLDPKMYIIPFQKSHPFIIASNNPYILIFFRSFGRQRTKLSYN